MGLGNPGNKYENSRHNVGFMVIDRLASRLGISLSRPFFSSMTGQVYIDNKKILLVKPQTYMNLSGQSVAPIVKWYKLKPDDLLVIYDDMDLPAGSLRIRPKGGSGGHRGMESIIEHLGTNAFPRLRIGIGKPDSDGEDTIDWVLGGFSNREREIIESVKKKAVDAITLFVNEGINKAMNQYNC